MEPLCRDEETSLRFAAVKPVPASLTDVLLLGAVEVPLRCGKFLENAAADLVGPLLLPIVEWPC